MTAIKALCVAVGTFAAFVITVSACRRDDATKPSADSSVSRASTSSELLREGAMAPNVEMKVHTGQTLRFSELRGKPVVVYFYPKDDTPGCTVEAQELRDLWSDIQKTSAVVIGVSTDGEASHRDFVAKYELPFLLAADEDHRIANAFGVPLNQGRAKRVTFVVDAAGRIRKVFPAVTPKGHGAEVLATVKGVAAG